MKERKFELVTDYKPSGDQPEAISKLTDGINKGYREQTLLGVTGSGKTFTMANVIANVNKPTLVLAHNKILAAQLCSEFKEFFPIMQLNILSVITTIISRRHIFRVRILTLKRILRSMMKSIKCVILPQRLFQKEMM